METMWWTQALTLRERHSLADTHGSHDVDLQEKWWSHWRNSVGFSGDEAALAFRMGRYGSVDEVRRSMGSLGIDETTEVPRWAGDLERLYSREHWPHRERVVDVLTAGRGADRDAASGPLGWLAVAAPMLIEAHDRVLTGFLRIHGDGAAGEAAARSWFSHLWPAVLGRTAALISRTLVLEINADRVSGQLDGETPEERFSCFVESLYEGSRVRAMLGEYPVLFRRLLETIRQSAGVLLELAARLHEDRTLLEENLGIDATLEVIAITMDAGDTHRGGRTVAVITFEDGSRVVYKPRPSAVDTVFGDLVSWFSTELEAAGDVDLRAPGNIDRGPYGWAEFITEGTCDDEAAVRRFYRRQGILLSLLYLLGGSDFHFENTIAAGEHPQLIDLETFFHQTPESDGDGGLPDGDLAVHRALSESVIQVGLLPLPLWGTEDRPGVDFSGLGGEAGQVIPQKQNVLTGSGTDAARIESLDSADLPPQKNRPTMQGEDVRTADYVQDIIDGFTAGYRLLEQRREAVLRRVQGFADTELRFIVRHTATYARVLVESSHPDLNRDGLALDCFLDSIWAAARADPSLAGIVEAERDDLVAGDIPLFTFKPTERSLVSSSGSTFEDYFPRTGMDAVATRLEGFGTEDLQYQLWVVRAAFASRGVNPSEGQSTESAAPAAEGLPAAAVQAGSAERSDVDRVGAAVHGFVDRVIARSHGERDRSWPTMIPATGQQWTMAPMTDSLYSGKAGMALFLSAAGTALDREDARSLGRSLSEGIVQRLRTALQEEDGDRRQPAHRRLGAYDGIGGLLFAAVETGALGASGAVDLALEAIGSSHVQDDAPADVIGGRIGLLAALGRWPATSGRFESLREAVVSALPSIAEPAAGSSAAHWPSGPGYGHGLPGAAAALASWPVLETGRHLSDRRLLEALGPDLLTAGETALAPSPSSWCRGGLGSVAAHLRLEALNPDAVTGSLRALSARALEDVSASPWPPDDSLCHGTAAAYALLEEARIAGLTSPEADERGCRLRADLLARAEQGRLRSLAPGGVETLGLMDGQAGVYFTLLRTLDPGLAPSVLTMSGPT